MRKKTLTKNRGIMAAEMFQGPEFRVLDGTVVLIKVPQSRQRIDLKWPCM